ncbi:MAG: hypothetical protein H6Q33_4836 [Deltaproteobacteria bacterium]|nr:hypothetical protein [Deltaproteobacteria bacterium]
MRKLIGSLSAIVALTLVASGVFAKDPVGNEVLPFEFDNPPVYNDCVGEIVNGHVVGETRYHEFETPSGTFHIVDQWRFKVYQTGTISGRVWVGYAVSPFQMNTRVEKGQVEQWVSNIKFIPLDEKAPAYFYNDDFKITVNANGELVVLHEEDLVGANFRCLGPKE